MEPSKINQARRRRELAVNLATNLLAEKETRIDAEDWERLCKLVAELFSDCGEKTRERTSRLLAGNDRLSAELRAVLKHYSRNNEYQDGTEKMENKTSSSSANSITERTAAVADSDFEKLIAYVAQSMNPLHKAEELLASQQISESRLMAFYWLGRPPVSELILQKITEKETVNSTVDRLSLNYPDPEVAISIIHRNLMKFKFQPEILMDALANTMMLSNATIQRIFTDPTGLSMLLTARALNVDLHTAALLTTVTIAPADRTKDRMRSLFGKFNKLPVNVARRMVKGWRDYERMEAPQVKAPTRSSEMLHETSVAQQNVRNRNATSSMKDVGHERFELAKKRNAGQN